MRLGLLNEQDSRHVMDNQLAMEVEKAYESRGAQEKYDHRRRRDQAQSYAQSD